MDKIYNNFIALMFWYKIKIITVIIQAHKQSTRWRVWWWYNWYTVVYRKWKYIHIQKITLAEKQFRYSVTQSTNRYYSFFLNYPVFYLPMENFLLYVLCGQLILSYYPTDASVYFIIVVANVNIQGVPAGLCLTSGGCSLC
jgi:hypothetical protein